MERNQWESAAEAILFALGEPVEETRLAQAIGCPREAAARACQSLAQGYEAEQAALNNEVIGLEDWVATREEMEDNLDQFLALMEKYVDIPELTPTIVNEFIKQIIVYAPEKVNSKRTQKVKIVFNFLEEVEVPEISEPIMTETTYGRRKTA